MKCTSGVCGHQKTEILSGVSAFVCGCAHMRAHDCVRAYLCECVPHDAGSLPSLFRRFGHVSVIYIYMKQRPLDATDTFV
jgi:hypothetical protein